MLRCGKRAGGLVGAMEGHTKVTPKRCRGGCIGAAGATHVIPAQAGISGGEGHRGHAALHWRRCSSPAEIPTVAGMTAWVEMRVADIGASPADEILHWKSRSAAFIPLPVQSGARPLPSPRNG